MIEKEEWLSASELSVRIDRSIQTISNWVKSGNLPYRWKKIPGQKKFRIYNLEDALEMLETTITDIQYGTPQPTTGDFGPLGDKSPEYDSENDAVVWPKGGMR